MLLFCDESWKESRHGKLVGTLAAVALDESDYNDLADRVFLLAEKYFGFENARKRELKGKNLLAQYEYRREQGGERSHKLDFARELLEELRRRQVKVFASVVFTEQEVSLLCEDETVLDRPYLFLMERINAYVEQLPNHSVATLVFDDRGLGQNSRVAQAFRNFLTRSRMGRSFNSLLRTPMFAYSHCSAGLQLADIVCTVVNRRYTAVGASPRIPVFFDIVKDMEWVAAGPNPDGHRLKGIKIIREPSARLRAADQNNAPN